MVNMSKSRLSAFVCVVFAAGGLGAVGASPVGLEERIAAQSAIEGVYWRHRIWPADNPGPKPSLDQVLPESVLRARVEDYVMQSKALEQLWARPIRDEDLQAEVERMAASSRAPQVLQEIFAALDNDPVLVAECLARPLLADRLIRSAYARDPRYHLALKTAIEQSLARHPSVADERALGGEYRESVWVLGGGRPGRAPRQAGARVIRMDPESWRDRLALLQAGFKSKSDPPVGVFGALQEDDESFYVQAVLEKDSGRLKVATAVWRKQPFDEWWAGAKTTLDSSASPEAGSRSGGETLPPLPQLTPAACTPDTWKVVQSIGAPTIREAHTAVWTGTEMIVWGGFNAITQLDTSTGSRYNPATNSWTDTAPTTVEARDTHTAVWTGTRMVVWGGGNEVFVPKNTGGRYDPTTNTWQTTATTGGPVARESHTAVWTGSRMVVWGGYNSTFTDINTGGRYDPVTDSWASTNGTGAPSPRDAHTAVWTGTRMVVWGGEDDTPLALNTGARYDPGANSWSDTAAAPTVAARWFHTAVWTGTKMIVWGGFDGVSDLNSGGVYDPAANTWAVTSVVGAPAARDNHTAVWTDSLNEMDVWGGQDDSVTQLNTGARYNPTTSVWTAMSQLVAPIGRRFHTVSWTGSEMIPWGGWNSKSGDLNSGGLYCSGACASAPPAGSSTISAGKQPGTVLFSWTAVPAAAVYDVVRGGLNLLRSSGGNFTTSTQACLANDQEATSVLDPSAPPLSDGFWYLLRGMSCGGAGTYIETVGSQIGSRDSEINASLNTCP
jgi:hypothetical protein